MRERDMRRLVDGVKRDLYGFKRRDRAKMIIFAVCAMLGLAITAAMVWFAMP